MQKMKKTVFSFVFCLISLSGLHAQNIVQIGNDWLVPSSTLYSPIYRFSATSTTRHVASNIVFEQSELLAAGITPGTRIDSIAFQKGNDAASTSPFLFRMLIGTSSRTAPLPLTLSWDTVSAGKQEVINNPSFTLRSDTGWYVFNFSSPFTYLGGTLEIATLLDYGTSASSAVNNFVQWRYTGGFAGHIIGLTNSSTTFPTGNAMNGNVSTYKHRPNIRFYTGAAQSNDAALSALIGLAPPLLAGTSQQVSVRVSNIGNNALTAVALNYQLNQGPVVSQSFTTQIASGANDVLTFSVPAQIPSGQNFQLRAWLSGINGGGPDPNAANDSVVSTICTALPAGTITVGATGDFPSLQAVFNQLSCGGIGGQVTVQINENQTGSFSLSAIPGIANGGVVLTSLNQSSIGNAGTGSVMSLNGVSNLSIQNLNFERTAAPTAAQFLLVGDNCSNITVAANTFNGFPGSTSTNNNLVRFNNSQSISIVQNQLRNGNIGYQSNASVANQPNFAHNVSSNLFENLNGTAILFDGTGGSSQAIVEGNTISNLTVTPSTTADGISFSLLNNTVIRRNLITGGIGRYGIHLNNYNGSASSPNLVVNNVVSGLFASTTANAFRLTSVGSALADRDYARVINNSFNLRTSTSSTTANGVVFITGGTASAPTANGIEFRNNLVSIGHTGTAPAALRMLHFSNAVYLDSSLITFSNNFYSNGTTDFANIASPAQVISTLAAWQALAQTPDQNSAIGNPQVIGLASDDLRPNTASPLVNAGLFQADITTDITGLQRDAQPDIGAYEFVSILNSAALTRIISPAQGRLLPGSQTVTLRFTNAGTNVISSLQLSYRIGQNSPTTETWSGTLNPGDSINYTFNTSLTVPNQLSINLPFIAWIAQPNGQSDLNPNNDTIVQPLCVPINAGTYTVGSSTSTFPDVSAWLNYLSCAGIAGPVTFNMELPNDVYTAGTLRLINIPGVSPSNTITLNGQGDTIRFEAVTSNRALIYLENTDHVTIRNFNLVSTAANFGHGIHLNGSDSISIIGNRIDLSAVTTTTATQTNGIIASASPSAFTATTAQALFIDSNIIIGGNSGIRVVGNSANKSRNLYIGRNTIRDFYQNGIFLVQVDSAIVERNDVNRALRTGVTTFQGINLEAGAEGVMIRNNRIHSGFNSATARTAAAFGVRISTPGTITKTNYIVNNLIYGFSTTGNQNGILLNATNSTDVLFNTILLNDSLATGNARAVYLQALNQNVRIFNNNLVVSKEGTGEKQVLYLERDTTSVQINFNNYYTSATNGVVSLLHFGAVGYPSIQAWRAVYPHYDSLSTSGNPLFVNAGLGNLTPTSAVLDSSGTPISFVNTDFNGVVRGSTPDLGAIEFNPPQNDLALTQLLTTLEDGCVPSLQIPISIRVANIGNTGFDTLFLSYRINSQAIQRDTIATGLSSGSILNYTFRQPGNFTNLVDTLVVTAKANGDNNATNDTIRRVVNNFLALVVQVPSNQDFEGPTLPQALCISTGDSSQVLLLGNTVANLPINGSSSLVMMGSASGSPWTAPTVTNWWTINPNNLSEARFFVNAPNRGRFNLEFNLRQLFNTTAANNNFRVLVNGQPVTPIGASSPTFRPSNAASSSATNRLRYNLDTFAIGGSVEITLQSSVRFNTSNATPNANAIDSLRLFESDDIRFQNLTQLANLCEPAAQIITVRLDTLNAPTAVALHYGIGSSFTSTPMTRTSTAGVWQATIPTQAPLNTVRYFVGAQSGSQTYTSDTLSFQNVADRVDLGPDRNLVAGQQTTLSVQVNGTSGGFTRFTEFMHWKSPAANIQTTYPTGVPNNADDMIEFTNFGVDTLELAGKRMTLFGGTTRLNLSFPQGARLAPNAVAVVMPGTGTNDLVNNVYFMGGSSNNILTSTNVNGAVLRDTVNGTVIDVVLTNDSVLPADLNLPANLWSGRINSNSLTGVRRVSTSSFGAANWGLYSPTDTTGFGYLNSGLTILPPANQVVWFTGATQVGTGYSLTVSPNATTTYHVSMPLRGCTLRDTVVVNVSALSQPDLLVARILSPVTGNTNITAPLVPRIRIRNQGTAIANGFTVNMTVNGSSVGVQNFTQVIAANDSLEVSLNNWNPTSGTYEVCFRLSTSNESDTTNNRSCVNGVQISNTTSIQDINPLGVRLYPNPAQNELHVELPDANKAYELQWMDAAGRVLGRLHHEAATASKAMLNVQGLANGVYFLRVQSQDGVFSHLRFVVTR